MVPGKAGLRAESLGRHNGKPINDEFFCNTASIKRSTLRGLKDVMS